MSWKWEDRLTQFAEDHAVAGLISSVLLLAGCVGTLIYLWQR